MHICIVGTGASGWIAAHFLKNNKNVKKITIVGSDKIPTIGVGESTTNSFKDFLLDKMHLDGESYTKFLADSDAAFKYGVMYKNWSDKDFLHPFAIGQHTGYLLGNKDPKEEYLDYVSPIKDAIYNNKVYFGDNRHEFSYHFDANKFIKTMSDLAKKEEKITHIVDTVLDSEYNNKDEVVALILESGQKINADFFVSCIGQEAFNVKVFKEKYIKYDNILLTNKAVACPIDFEKDDDYHPYTVSKTMNNGWRWITPTKSRIGTGYVFSDKHISVDEATSELLKDIGDRKPIIDPFVVDFTPRRVREIFKANVCTLGMAAGFLEPLDAPGLSLTLRFCAFLDDVLNKKNTPEYKHLKIYYNDQAKIDYDFFCSFILHQYKTANRTDTQFWIDQKNVEFDFYNQVLGYVFDPIINKNGFPVFHEYVREPWMFFNSTAGKDIRWEVKIKDDLVPIQRNNYLGHLLYDHKDLLKKIEEDAYSGVGIPG